MVWPEAGIVVFGEILPESRVMVGAIIIGPIWV